MKTIKILSITAALSIAVILTTTAITRVSHKNATPTVTNNGFAVVELFTSEGCSSCPPADELVARIQKESADKPIYILAFHVDYCNRLGWKDVFSSAAYSQRQNQYAKWLNLSSVYTPQAIVNGRTEFVGSEESTLRYNITTDLQKSAKNELTLDNLKLKNSEASLQYHVQGKLGNSSLLIALVEKTATSKVLRGENAGRTLSHVQLVSKLQTVVLKDQSGPINITLPVDFTTQNYEIIGFVQSNKNGEITGAGKTNFTSALSASNNP